MHRVVILNYYWKKCFSLLWISIKLSNKSKYDPGPKMIISGCFCWTLHSTTAAVFCVSEIFSLIFRWSQRLLSFILSFLPKGRKDEWEGSTLKKFMHWEREKKFKIMKRLLLLLQSKLIHHWEKMALREKKWTEENSLGMQKSWKHPIIEKKLTKEFKQREKCVRESEGRKNFFWILD